MAFRIFLTFQRQSEFGRMQYQSPYKRYLLLCIAFAVAADSFVLSYSVTYDQTSHDSIPFNNEVDLEEESDSLESDSVIGSARPLLPGVLPETPPRNVHSSANVDIGAQIALSVVAPRPPPLGLFC